MTYPNEQNRIFKEETVELDEGVGEKLPNNIKNLNKFSEDYQYLRTLSVPEALIHATEIEPEKEALVDGDVRLSYQELQASAEALAAGLQNLGVQKGDRIGVCLPNWHEFLVSHFAIGLLGAVLIPLNTRYKNREVEYILNNSGAKVLITAERFDEAMLLEMYREVRARVPRLETVIVVRAQADLPEGYYEFTDVLTRGRSGDLAIPQIDPQEDLFAILYTSGTTGAPKGAMLTHANLMQNAVMTGKTLECSPQDVFLLAVPVFHVFGMSATILIAISYRSKLVMMDVYKARKALELIESEKITVHHAVPTMFILELNDPEFSRFDLSSLRTGIIAAAPCPVEVVRAIRTKMGCNICVSYGMTEASPSLTITNLDDDDVDKAETVGRCLPGVELKIVDDRRQEVGVNVVGEVVARSFGIFKGYYGKPEETAQVLTPDGWFYTGDLGVLDERGFLRIVGRKKEMVIRGGYNIYPRELEEVLYTHPAVLEAAVVGIPDPVLGERTCACIRVKAGHTVTADEIKEFMRRNLADYKIPDRVEFMERFPTTASGKIRKIDLVKNLI